MKQIRRLYALSIVGLLAGQSAFSGAAMADGLLGTTSEDTFELSVELTEAPQQIMISGMTDILISKTIGDQAIEDQETSACVYMDGGGQYSIQVTANPLTDSGKHYPYEIEIFQNAISSPSVELTVSDATVEDGRSGFEASPQQNCAQPPKLRIRVTDVGSDEITDAFSATATIKIAVEPQ